MATEITTAPGTATVEDWWEGQRQQRLQIAQLDTPKVARRAAELNAILETASAKIDRFGWNQMDKHIKDQLCSEWCDALSQYTLDEVRAGVCAVFAASNGKLRSINEYQVQEQIVLEHGQVLDRLPNQPPAPEAERDFSPEAVARRKAHSDKLLGRSVRAPRDPAKTLLETAKDIVEGEIS